jgi:hypothetical protein
MDEEEKKPDVYVARPVAAKALPPIADIIVPKTATKSAMIRWLVAMGYSILDIHHWSGIQYQMVRNIAKSVPKRAAREDLPPLKLEYRQDGDLIDAAMDGALEASLLEERKARKKEEAAARRADRAAFPDGDEEVDEIGED